jgi:hypothetical protein
MPMRSPAGSHPHRRQAIPDPDARGKDPGAGRVLTPGIPLGGAWSYSQLRRLKTR